MDRQKRYSLQSFRAGGPDRTPSRELFIMLVLSRLRRFVLPQKLPTLAIQIVRARLLRMAYLWCLTEEGATENYIVLLQFTIR